MGRPAPNPWLAGCLVLLAGCLVFLGSCAAHRPEPDELYKKARAAFEEERFEEALALVPNATLLGEMGASADVRDRFAVLEAELLTQRPDPGPGLARLSKPLRSGADPALDRQRRRALGYGRCRTARSAADREAGEAILDALLAEVPAGSQEAGSIELRRGICLRALERTEAAEASFRSAADAASQVGDKLLEARAYSSLANLCATRERFDEAAQLTRRALDLAAAAGPAGRNTRRRAFDNLGWHQYELGDYERAIDTLRQFEPIHDRERLVNENNQARTLLALGDLPGAAEHYRKALAAARGQGNVNRGDQVAVLQGLAAVAIRGQKWYEARQWNEEARTLARTMGEEELERHSVLLGARIEAAEGDVAAAEAPLRSLAATASASRALRWSARTELARLQASRGRLREAEAEINAAIRLVEEGRSLLTQTEDRISFLSGRIEVYREAVHILLQQNRPSEALRAAARSRARSLRDQSAGAAARPGAVVFFYWLDDPVSHLWVVEPNGAPAYFRLPGAREIESLVERHNAFLLRARDPLNEGGAEARKLFAMLVGPARDRVAGRHVLLSPDGALHALNFDTLIAPGPDHYWLEDVRISVVPGLLAAARPPGPAAHGALLAGAATGEEPGLPPLRHAAAELQALAPLLDSTALTGAAATPQAALAGLRRNPEYVHFAAHAVANRLRPLESAIVLSPAGGSTKLYARELAELRLRSRLVTLSACSAAGARAFRGEGLVGFAWSFLGAGAENVVASLWPVEDASTPRLMAEMYRQIQLGKAPGDALREAKLALLRSGTALKKPYFWGAFLHFQP